MTPPIAAAVHLVQAGPSLRMTVQVRSARPRPLTWALSVKAHSRGGSNQVSQSGDTRGQDDRPLATVTLNGTASGVAELTVRDAGGVVVSHAACRFGAAPPDPSLPPC